MLLSMIHQSFGAYRSPDGADCSILDLSSSDSECLLVADSKIHIAFLRDFTVRLRELLQHSSDASVMKHEVDQFAVVNNLPELIDPPRIYPIKRATILRFLIISSTRPRFSAQIFLFPSFLARRTMVSLHHPSISSATILHSAQDIHSGTTVRPSEKVLTIS